MFILYWPLVIIITIALYVLMLLTLPFNEVYATIFLFSLISFWSRLPGVGIPTPMYLLYLADLVDFFSLIIAINLGGPVAVVFTVIWNLASRACGIFPAWRAVIKDAIAQGVACLVIPFIHVAMGGDIFVSMIIYTLIRVLMLYPLIIMPGSWGVVRLTVQVVIPSGIAQLFINGIYAKLFGPYFDNLLQSGVSFNWTLFLIATIIILAFKIYAFGTSNTKNSLTFKSFKKVVSTIKKNVPKKKTQEKLKVDKDKAEMDFVRNLNR